MSMSWRASASGSIGMLLADSMAAEEGARGRVVRELAADALEIGIVRIDQPDLVTELRRANRLAAGDGEAELREAPLAIVESAGECDTKLARRVIEVVVEQCVFAGAEVCCC